METKSMLRRAHDAAVGYHLLVALLFTGCLPVAIARAIGPAGGMGADGPAAGPIAAALDTARAAAAQAFSLPG